MIFSSVAMCGRLQHDARNMADHREKHMNRKPRRMLRVRDGCAHTKKVRALLLVFVLSGRNIHVLRQVEHRKQMSESEMLLGRPESECSTQYVHAIHCIQSIADYQD